MPNLVEFLANFFLCIFFYYILCSDLYSNSYFSLFFWYIIIPIDFTKKNLIRNIFCWKQKTSWSTSAISETYKCFHNILKLFGILTSFSFTKLNQYVFVCNKNDIYKLCHNLLNDLRPITKFQDSFKLHRIIA